MHLLLVDDHQTFADMLAEYLERVGPELSNEPVEVTTASTLEDGIRVATSAEVPPNLVILDLNLGGTDYGTCTLRRFQEANTRKVPVAILTGMSFEEDDASDIVRECYFSLGARGLLLKGSRLQQTFTGLARILNGERFLPEKAILLLSQPPIPRSSSLTETTVGIKFTERQQSVADRIARGLRNKEIARELDKSDLYVRQIVAEVFRKLNVHTRTQATIELLKQDSPTVVGP
jgi:two-component system, NarL family, nitrate/nitrite response regulator NarL